MSIKIYSNKFILRFISVIAGILIIRLAMAANDYDNWRGFFYSTLHVLAVAYFTYLAVCNKQNPSTKN